MVLSYYIMTGGQVMRRIRFQAPLALLLIAGVATPFSGRGLAALHQEARLHGAIHLVADGGNPPWPGSSPVVLLADGGNPPWPGSSPVVLLADGGNPPWPGGGSVSTILPA